MKKRREQEKRRSNLFWVMEIVIKIQARSFGRPGNQPMAPLFQTSMGRNRKKSRGIKKNIRSFMRWYP